jgi:hypothetical protein
VLVPGIKRKAEVSGPEGKLCKADSRVVPQHAWFGQAPSFNRYDKPDEITIITRMAKIHTYRGLLGAIQLITEGSCHDMYL